MASILFLVSAVSCRHKADVFLKEIRSFSCQPGGPPINTITETLFPLRDSTALAIVNNHELVLYDLNSGNSIKSYKSDTSLVTFLAKQSGDKRMNDLQYYLRSSEKKASLQLFSLHTLSVQNDKIYAPYFVAAPRIDTANDQIVINVLYEPIMLVLNNDLELIDTIFIKSQTDYGSFNLPFTFHNNKILSTNIAVVKDQPIPAFSEFSLSEDSLLQTDVSLLTFSSEVLRGLQFSTVFTSFSEDRPDLFCDSRAVRSLVGSDESVNLLEPEDTSSIIIQFSSPAPGMFYGIRLTLNPQGEREFSVVKYERSADIRSIEPLPFAGEKILSLMLQGRQLVVLSNRLDQYNWTTYALQ